ncbi:MAG: 2-dehydropantoate 2-reductase [Paludibacteraceae bacterium]|jgi:2-dehydropantoate 2-reductase|nr:2-dehydropantoate 2-reductase [Prevotella sp.]MBQ8706047.1 2-dehydropantoate 2-reductase [Paludibacteraceae bacterium]MBQ8713975.1 2-dehydropantoate 2-reductase [Prevotella sp.]
MNYTVIGTGAIGGYYGGRLMKAGRQVRFLLRSDYEYVRQHGLQIDSCDGSFHLDGVDAYNDTRQMPKTDVVLVCLKSINNHKLKEMLPPIIDERTTVVMIQNGIGLEDDLQAEFPGLHIVAGLAFICSGKVGPGHVSHQCYGSINLGNYSCPDEHFREILAEFQDAGIDAAEVPYLEARWKKAVWNMPFNGMTVALNTSTDKLLQNPSTRQLIYDQMMEVIGAANALGVKALTSEFADKMMAMTDAMVPYSPSMKLDYDNHRKMEIPYLYTRPIAEAKKVGFEMPKLAMLEAELKFIESQY